MYESPRITDLGSLAELTAASVNKIGARPDMYSNDVPIVGSLTPLP